MHLHLKFELDGLDWDVAATVYTKAGVTKPEPLRGTFEQAKDICLAYDIDYLVGLARLVEGENGLEVRDLAMIPYAAGFDIGRTMIEYLAKRAKGDAVLVPAGESEKKLYTELQLAEFF